MPKVTSGGGWAAIGYTIAKSLKAYGGPAAFWRRMASRNSCKTCALGMGGQQGGMRNEAGHFPYREHPRQFAAEVDGFISFWRNFRK